MIEFRRMPLEQVPWSALDQYDDRVVFQTREWLDFIAESQGAEPVVAEIRDGGDIAGYFSGVVVRKFGVRILGSSFPGWTTPFIGFNLKSTVARSSVLASFGPWVFRDLRCMHYEVSDRLFVPEDGSRLGLASTSYSSYRTDLTRTEDQLFQAMDSACRRCIRKAEKSGVVIEETTSPDFAGEYYDQLKDVFAKQGVQPTYTVDRVRVLLKHLLPTGRLLLLRAISPEGKCIGTGIYPALNHLASFWGNASWRTEQHWRPNEALHWYAMRYWKARGIRVFDWGGGGTYKEKYGVEPYSVPWFYQSKYQFVAACRDAASQMFYRSQRIIGRLRGVKGPGKTDAGRAEPT